MHDSASALIRSRTDFQQALLSWYRASRRTLPWREAPSLYKTVVSEFMLQQTQVKTVLPYFARWLEAFPDFATLAAAPEERVLKHWEGLGYYTRARNLHKLARSLAALPAVPQKPADWLALPGIGPYTAAAITSISFGEPVAVVDGNVVRILTRLTADGTEFRDSATASKYFAALANEIVNPGEPGDHNQAMMELGATVCHRQNPLCTVCPVIRFCAGRKKGDPESYPRLAAKTITAVNVTRAWCVHDGRLLLHRAAASSRRLASMHELPSAEHLGFKPEQLASAGLLLAKKKRGITRYAITENIHSLPASAIPFPVNALPDGLLWVSLADLGSVTFSGPHRRWVEELARTLTGD